jgi:hypothetical protein
MTQLDLLTGKAARKLLQAKEFETQCMVADLLNRWKTPGWFASHIGHGERRELKAAQRLKRGGLKPGLPDFIIVGPSTTCGFHFLELKKYPNKLTPEQKIVADVIVSAQGKYAVAYGFDAAVAVLKGWGAVRVAA